MTGGFRSRSRGAQQAGAQSQQQVQRQPQQRGPQQGAKRGGGRQGIGKQGNKQGGNKQGSNKHGAGKQGSGKHSLVQAARNAGVDAPRAVAFSTLLRVEEDGAYANLVLPKALKAAGLDGRDAAFATEVTYGTLRTQGVLDAAIERCSSRPLGQLTVEVLAALRLGAYQVLYTRVEPHAAVDTTVRLVEAAGQERAKGFANAVMRSLTRTPAKRWLEILAPQGEIPALAFQHAHPAWIAQSFARVLGLAELPEALAADSERPLVHLVARPGEISAEELALITGNEVGRYSPYAVYMEHGDPGKLEPVQEKLAGVQDEGSQLIARAVAEAAVEGEDSGRWLDLCAGPGGKAALLGALARIEGAQVDAVEVSPHRAKLVRDVTDSLPVTVHVADGRAPGLEAGYDRILVDAPCSGLGALRRRPEARWRKSEADIAPLAQLQRELLASAWELVRPGGVIVYSTCSPDERETRQVVDWATRELGAVEADARGLIPDMGDVGNHPSVQMWPHRHGTDAMFFALLRKPVAAA
ncbi:MFS transporter [Corynebacterium lizhenjunii]|uniref:MFS transporter n=1 Tax=Corynebacterium lizhenjunii TaxID=2709394 RepID=A0A7T0PAZ0_9CORY|nr:transcription antitermination factor NusB [Corynebacterium lizhenjunii]QPK78192.1 MFS transporter [Corynebacterium lizhenjunii]